MLKRKCKTCGKGFNVPNSYGKNRGFYCSQKCYGISKEGKPSWNKGLHIQCNTGRTHFKKGIIPKTHWKKGHKPWNKGLRWWGNSIEKHPHWKGGRTIDRGYVSIKTPEHPFAHNGYVFEHRLVMEKHLGRFLKNGEQIHHIDFNKANNNLENLMLFPNNSAHRKFHVYLKRTTNK